MNADDNDDIPWGTDPASPDDIALQTDRNQLPAGDRRNPFLRAAPPVPADAAAAAVAAGKIPAPTVAARMSRRALLTGFAVLTAGVVLVVVNGLSSGTAATAPTVSAAVAHSSLASTSAAPVVSILRMTATVTITATATATTTATTTTRITAAPAVTPTTPPRSQPPLGKTISRSASVVVPTAAPATTPAATGVPTRLSVSASGSAVPGGVAVTASVDTDSAPVMVQVHVSGPQGSQQFAMAPAAAGGGTYARTVHTAVGVVAVTVSATAGTRSASSAPFTVRVPS